MLNENKDKYDNDLPDQTIYNLLYAGNWISEIYSDYLKQYALSIQQFDLLRSLRKLDGKPANLSELHEQMISKMSNTTRLVEKLRLKGLLTRSQNEENRRKIEIRITEKGISLLDEIDTTYGDFKKVVVEKLTKSNLENLNMLLEKIRS